MLAGFSNEPIIRLSQNLVRITPPNLKKCFYGDSGSSAVEIALKLAFHATAIDDGWASGTASEASYTASFAAAKLSQKDAHAGKGLDNANEWASQTEAQTSHLNLNNPSQSPQSSHANAHSQAQPHPHTPPQNQPKPLKDLYLCLSNSYHGETLGALSLSDVGIYKSVYTPLLFRPLVTPAPNRSLGVSEEQAKAELIRTLGVHSGRIAAFIAEPLLQCAGGMNMYPASFLNLPCVSAVRAVFTSSLMRSPLALDARARCLRLSI